MSIQRRDFLQILGRAGIATPLLGATGCKPGDESFVAPGYLAGEADLPWLNWAANQSCTPASRLAPASIDELLENLKAARGTVRPVGSGHSFSPLVPTQDTLLTTDLLTGVTKSDPGKLRATVLGGTRLGNLAPMLDAIGQALTNLPDMDYPSVAGALATSTHGTGVDFGSIATQVEALTLATPRGELLACSRENNSELFDAARTSLGALGVIAEVTLVNQSPYRLTEVTKVENLYEVLEDIVARKQQNRHFEIFPFPHSSMCMTVTTNLAKPGDANQGEEDVYAVERIKDLYDALAGLPGIGLSLYGQNILDGAGVGVYDCADRRVL